MSRVPDFFGLGADTNLTSVDFADMATGEKFITYYFGKGTSLFLAKPNTFYSEDIYSDAINCGGGGTFLRKAEYDFDIALNSQMVLWGSSLITIPMMMIGGASDMYNDAYFCVYVRKYNGSAETHVVSGSSTIFTGTAATTLYKRATLPITIPQTTFNEGSYIRITLELWTRSYNSAGSSPTIRIGHDPMARTDAVWTNTTILPNIVFNMPIKVSS